MNTNIHLEKVSLNPLVGVEELLLELGPGENGFGGTSFGTGTAALHECLQALIDTEDPTRLSPGFVVQTVFWMVDQNLRVVGMSATMCVPPNVGRVMPQSDCGWRSHFLSRWVLIACW